jgi:tRNA(adenine34) deaminase
MPKKQAHKRKAAPDSKKGAPARRRKTDHRWVRKVNTVSTFPPEGTFTKDAETIARVMASKRVSPKGLGSGIKMVQYFLNRGGKKLPAQQRREVEKAKRILQEKNAAET